jgi:hypothetical protein
MSDSEPSRADWDREFSRLAIADYRLWAMFEPEGELAAFRTSVPTCQRLMLLQMACEKLCKAHIYRGGSDIPDDAQTSHAHVSKRLPQVLREEMRRLGCSAETVNRQVSQQRLIAREIELLNPAVKDGGRRLDNCEYPWQEQYLVRSPLDYSFPIEDLFRSRPHGPSILKLIKTAFEREIGIT